jgi:hypothetical protein
MKFDLLHLHGLHLATEENRLMVMKFRCRIFFFTFADVVGLQSFTHDEINTQRSGCQMHDGAPRCRPPLESWRSKHAGSRLQGEVPVDGARMADGAVTRLAAAASSVCILSASRPQVAGHGDCGDGVRRLQRRRLLRATIAAPAASNAGGIVGVFYGRRQHVYCRWGSWPRAVASLVDVRSYLPSAEENRVLGGRADPFL